MLSSKDFLFKKNAPEALRIIGTMAMLRKSSAVAMWGVLILYAKKT